MSALPVDVSTSPTATFALVVDDVDFELRVDEDLGQGQTPIFDASKGQQGVRCPLLIRGTYVLRYNNNDGGAGLLHFRISSRAPRRSSARQCAWAPSQRPW
jgi:hypothetical protein